MLRVTVGLQAHGPRGSRQPPQAQEQAGSPEAPAATETPPPALRPPQARTLPSRAAGLSVPLVSQTLTVLYPKEQKKQPMAAPHPRVFWETQ